MRVPVAEVVEAEVARWEADVGLSIQPNHEWVP